MYEAVLISGPVWVTSTKILHVRVPVYIYICVCVCVCMCVCVYVCMYVCMHLCMYMYICFKQSCYYIRITDFPTERNPRKGTPF